MRRHYGVRTERYSLMHFYNDMDEWELFDLQEDPMQLKNLYGQEGYESIRNCSPNWCACNGNMTTPPWPLIKKGPSYFKWTPRLFTTTSGYF